MSGLSERDDPKPGTLEYAQMVAEKYGDLDDAAVEDGMDPVPGLSERDVERLADLLTQQSVRVQVPNVGTMTGFLRRESAERLASQLAERDAAIRVKAKAEALAPIRALADEFRREADKADKRSDGVSYARRTAWDRAADRLFALLDGGDQS